MLYKKLFFVFVALLFMAPLSVASQSSEDVALETTSYEDLLMAIVHRHEADTVPSDDVRLNPRFYRLFGVPTLYASSVDRVLNGAEAYNQEIFTSSSEYLQINQESMWSQQDLLEQEIDRAVLMASVVNPEYFVYTEDQIKSEQIVSPSDVAEQEPTANFKPIDASWQDADKAVGVNMKVKKPNFWKTSGETSLQFTQNYISGNWSQGGESTNTMVAGLILKANYNDQQKFTWDNMIEAKLGFTTAPSDTVHNYRTNTDMLRLSSKIGLKAFKSWYYTIDVMSKTQFLRNYNSNSNKFTSAFLAPLETTVGIGMDYKKNLKKFNISVNIAPLSYRYVYVSERYMVASRYGIKNGHRSLQEYGSKMVVKSSWKLHKNISWTSHLDAFTSYKKVYANWENTFDFAVSKYLSTKLFMHGRFDDGVNKRKGYSYFQFKEFLQFGLSYKW